MKKGGGPDLNYTPTGGQDKEKASEQERRRSKEAQSIQTSSRRRITTTTSKSASSNRDHSIPVKDSRGRSSAARPRTLVANHELCITSCHAPQFKHDKLHS